MPIGDLENATKMELAKDLPQPGDPRSTDHERQKMAILVRCTQDLERSIAELQISMDKSSAAGQKLAVGVFWLNVVLAVATVVAVAVAVAEFCAGR